LPRKTYETGVNRRAIVPTDSDETRLLREKLQALTDYGVTEYSDGTLTLKIANQVFVTSDPVSAPQQGKPALDPTDAMDLALTLSDASAASMSGAPGKQ
jgi:hypothetical protein